MDLSTPDRVRDELLKVDPSFRELVHQHTNYEQRLQELAHLTYPNDDEQQEESLLKKNNLTVKDEIYAIMSQFEVSH